MKTPRYTGCKPSSERASKAARGSSKKVDTTPEWALRQALWHAGCRYRKNADWLPGKPDVAFPGPRVAVFCDGDFWHGRDWPERQIKLSRGANAVYWLAKIARNMERDQEVTRALEADGWKVIRLWERDVLCEPATAVRTVLEALGDRAPGATRR